jgi:hypothetical protein
LTGTAVMKDAALGTVMLFCLLGAERRPSVQSQRQNLNNFALINFRIYYDRDFWGNRMTVSA